jgi:hypothetical protein
MVYADEDEVRLALERKLRKTVDAETWDLLVEERYVASVKEGDEELEELVYQYKRHERRSPPEREVLKNLTTRGPRQQSPEKEEQPDKRFELISQLLANEATDRPDVRKFRREHLHNNLLGRGEVAPWLEEKAREEAKAGLPSQWLKFPLPKGHTIRPNQKTESIKVVPPLTTLPMYGVSRDRELLEWAGEDGIVPGHTYVAHGGVLHELQLLGKYLAKMYGWQEAQATTFVLTGVCPLVSQLRFGVNYSVGKDYRPRARITLNVDPEVSPAKVAEVYRKVRQSVRSGKRNKPMSERILTLVEFALEQRRLGKKWEDIMELWNRRYPKWKVLKPKRQSGKDPEAEALRRALWNFNRDYNRAVEGLFKELKYSALPELGKKKGEKQ